MSKTSLLIALTMAACATGTTGGLHAVSGSCEIAPLGHGHEAFPDAVDPQLPRVDRIAQAVRVRLGDRAEALVDVCIASDGRVTNVTLLRGSAYDAFDAALLQDVQDWQFAPDLTSQPKCKRATIAYRRAS